MKKIFPIIAILIVSLLFGGCTEREDLIPEKLGEPEGLWLYRGTERMRTDGSERELLFDEVELDGIIYTTENFEVQYNLYCTDTKTIFAVLTVGGSDYLYCYNYAEKRGKQLSGACESGGCHPYYICASGLHDSESYVCFESLRQQKTETVSRLFLRDGTPVCENMTNFEFSQDILYKFEESEEGNTLTWWKDGALHTLSIPAWESYADDFYDGALIYRFTEDGQGLAVDVDTEEVFSISYEGNYDDSDAHNGILWFVTREPHNTDGTVTDWDYYNRLYRFTPAGCELIYTFEHERLARINATDEAVYLCWYDEHWRTTYQEYDIAEKVIKESKQYYPETESTFTCGEYTFWVEYKTYGWSGQCYYLYRQHGGTVDIMQYIFNDDPNFGKSFFDDICDF